MEKEKRVEEDIGKYGSDNNHEKSKRNGVSDNIKPVDQIDPLLNEEKKLDNPLEMKSQNKDLSPRSKLEVKKEKKTKRKSKVTKYKTRITDLNKELEELKARLQKLSDTVKSVVTTNDGNINNKNSREHEEALNIERKPVGKYNDSVTAKEAKPRSVEPENIQNQYEYKSEIPTRIFEKLAVETSQSKDKATSPPSPETVRKNKVKAAKREMRKKKEEKELRKFFNDPFFKDEEKSESELADRVHNAMDHRRYGSGSGGSSYGAPMSDTNNMYGISPYKLDDQVMYDDNHSMQRLHSRNVSNFIDSTLKPGDGVIG